MKEYISKSTMMRAIQCQLAFYYDLIEVAVPHSKEPNYLFQQGNEVEKHAKRMYSTGIDCSAADGNIYKALSKTEFLLYIS